MIFRQLFDYGTWTYSYLLADESSREAIIIDSVNNQVSRDLKLLHELGLKLVYCVETHIHADHITGAGELRKHTGCMTAVSHNVTAECPDRKLRDGDIVSAGNIELKVIETPGHTDTCLSFSSNGRVFTGDTLLIRGCGRTDFQSGDPAVLYDSITTKLFNLPGSTLIYPGHDYQGYSASTIEEEKKFNPRLQLDKASFVDHMNKLELPNPKMMDVAVPANLVCGKE